MTSEVYSAKAEYYAKYRWDYPEVAVRRIIEAAQITPDSCVADIGAGTGMLTKHLAPLVKRIYAIEPNAAMRQQAERVLGAFPSCIVSDGSAEHTGLADNSADLITVAQAIHWFDPEPTRQEFTRILRPGGWFAVIRNSRMGDDLSMATDRLMTEEYGVKQEIQELQRSITPTPFYYGTGSWQRHTFPISLRIDWETYLGSLLSTSYTPEEDHPQYEHFVTAARDIFDQFSTDNYYTITGETELYIGQP